MNRVRFCRAFTALVLSAGFAMQAWALPALPSVVSGNASFISNGNTLDITSSSNAIINWDDFSIGSGETVRFIQPGDSSAVLLRMTGAVPSSILGTLFSNGRLFLTNSQGFSFGNGSLLDADSLWISDSGLTDADFLAGNFNVQPTGNTGNIVIDGTIRVAPGGSVSLVSGGGININAGSIDFLAGGNINLNGGTLALTDYSQLVGTGGNISLGGGTLTLNGNIPAVPEPDIVLLMIVGIGVLGAMVRRRAAALA